MSKRSKTILSLVVLLLCATGVRSYHASRWSLDVDEAFTAGEANTVSLGTLRDYLTLRNARLETTPRSSDWQDKIVVIQTFLTHTFPLYYLLQRHVLARRGTTESSLRLLSVLFGVLAIPLAYWVGRRHFSERVGWLFAAFTLFHPLVQFHSQNARYYSLAFFGTLLAMYLSLSARALLLDDKRGGWVEAKLTLIGALLWIPMLIHGSSIFAMIFAAAILLETLLELKLHTFLRKARCLLPPLILGGTLVTANQVYFLRARLLEGLQPGDELQLGGSYLLHNLVSLVFNLGLQFWLLVPIALWLVISERHRTRRSAVLTLLLSLTVYGALSLRSTEIRFDYFYPALPFLLLVVALALDSSVERLLPDARRRPAVVAFAGVFLVLLGLPSFISTLAIDGDRTDWRAALQWVNDDAVKRSGSASPLVFSAAPGLVSQYATAGQARRLRDLDPAATHSGAYCLVPWKRAGLDLRGIPDRVQRLLFEGATLLHVIGRDRLDLHINRLAIFRIR